MNHLILGIWLVFAPPPAANPPAKVDPFDPNQIVTDGPVAKVRSKLDKVAALFPTREQSEQMTPSSLSARMTLIAGQANTLWQELEAAHFLDERFETDRAFRLAAQRDWRWSLYSEALMLAAAAHRGLCDPNNPDGGSMADHCIELLNVWLRPGINKTPSQAPWIFWLIGGDFDSGRLEFFCAYAVRKYRWNMQGAGLFYFGLMHSACEKGNPGACEIVEPNEEREREVTETLLRHWEQSED
jgi:hypothetical protein